MPKATLLLREPNDTSLSAIVEKSQLKRPPLLEYELKLRSCQLDLILIGRETPTSQTSYSTQNKQNPDEGFESDVDSLSIVSSDDSFATSSNVPKTETDSANGSACSDTDEEAKEIPNPLEKETHELVNCLCYSDVKFPDVLVFVIESDALVFQFTNLEELQKFYTNFNTLKAVANQKTYGKEVGKFNLLQRVDGDGITHIEIKKEKIDLNLDYTTSVISLNTPESFIHEKILQKMNESFAPKKPERRKKAKGKAPPPPPTPPTQSSKVIVEENVLKGEYIRVNVPKIDVITEKLSHNSLNNHFNIYPQPKLTTYQQFKYISEPKTIRQQQQPTIRKIPEHWTNSMPRSSKFRSKSETRIFTPMAYRYIDTQSPIYSRKYNSPVVIQPVPITNRLFGMTGKLKDFSNYNHKFDSDMAKINESNRWNSLGELTSKNQIDNLKSVIKKEDVKKKEKKVTFSAYTTVQVV